ncbi:MAG: undecaprenyl-diphosphatase [Deltaproteobacteria bacterium]|nr:undecaprenyl-diphosphatase [Deltaproteobacteria bacterium]
MTTNLNVQIFQWIHAGAGDHLIVDGFAVFFAEGGPYLLAALFVVLWFFVDKNRKTALLEATEAAIVGLGINQLIGLFYFHPRPYMVGLCTPLFPHGPETSFPSDHATLMFAAAFYLLMARRWTTCGIVLLVVATLTAWGRVYSGMHFPFDMAGSLVVGLASAGLIHWLAGRLKPLNMKLIRVSHQLMDRVVRSLSHGTRRR